MKKRLALVLFSILIVYVAGCGVNPTGTDKSLADSSLSNNSVGMANLQIVLAPDTVSSLRGAAIGTKSFIRIVLFLANPGSSTTPYTKMQKLVALPASGGQVDASFFSVPAKPVLIQITLTEASIDNNRSFHGVADLVSGNNNVVKPVAIGSNNASDTAAKIFTEFIQSPTLMQSAPVDFKLTERIYKNISFVGSNDVYLALNSIAKEVASDYIEIALANSGSSLKVDLKTGSKTVTNAEFWSDGRLKTSKVQKILRPGMGGFGYVSWQADDASVSAISKVSTTNATNISACTNSGKLTQFVVLSDNSIIAGGYNSVKKCPVIFKWTPGTTGNVDAGTGLDWVYYFTGQSGSTYIVKKIVFNSEDTLLVDIENTTNSSILELRINSNTGVVPGLAEIAKAYTSMESILQNNTITSQQRVDGFMSYIAEDFRDIAGTANKKTELAATTLSRLERYTINSYTFTFAPENVQIVNSTTIKVTTPSVISVKRKLGAEGALKDAYIIVGPVPVITWKYYPSGWKIYQGLPYKSGEIGI